MPFGTLVVNTVNFEPRRPGVYQASTVSFGDPSNDIRISGGQKGRDGNYRSSITRILDKVTGVGADEKIHRAIISVAITADSEFTSSELESMISDCSVVGSSANISRIMVGEQ